MENYNIKFGNWSAMSKDKRNYTDLFEEYYNDDGGLVAFSKETYEHYENDDDLWFKYKLAIKVESMCAFIGENEDGFDDVYIELVIVPLPEYLNSKTEKSIADCMGTDCIDIYDIISYGGCPVLERECIKCTEDHYDVTEVDCIKEKLDACATIANCSNNLRGFALDRAWNLIGTTGWDLLHELIDGKDAIKSTWERYDKMKTAI